MKRTTRYLTGLLTATTLIVGLGAGTAQAESVQIPAPAVPPAKTVAAGMRLAFDDYTEKGNMCTLGAVGTDSGNRKVGITAGHCNPWETEGPLKRIYVGPMTQVHTLDNTHPVWDWRDVAAGPIGWIRWVSDDERDGPLRGPLDYMVIEFAENVTLSSQLMTTPKYGPNANGTPYDPNTSLDPGPIEVPSQPWWKMNEIYADAAGNPMNPGWNQTLCNAGSTTTQFFAQAGDPRNVRCGPIGYSSGGLLYSQAGMKPGDSGGPAFVQGQSNKWAGISSWIWPGGNLFYQHVYTSAKRILDDLNPRGITGSGFKITNN
ncbi:hypothetical protein [Rhodococcus maanshanensis]|uniref:Trypsin n=1 Tax=Rhodococcus maanshanensis TaxID=183556 RepID=A0A1H7N787_9NOCA|nr:hypothetical protein [Rhodococcus maanshanensis]SEL18828.1 hypothetical protein SAMN05444583_106255 [Rhodococcus maanshanensis]